MSLVVARLDGSRRQQLCTAAASSGKPEKGWTSRDGIRRLMMDMTIAPGPLCPRNGVPPVNIYG